MDIASAEGSLGITLTSAPTLLSDFHQDLATLCHLVTSFEFHPGFKCSDSGSILVSPTDFGHWMLQDIITLISHNIHLKT